MPLPATAVSAGFGWAGNCPGIRDGAVPAAGLSADDGEAPSFLLLAARRFSGGFGIMGLRAAGTGLSPGPAILPAGRAAVDPGPE